MGRKIGFEVFESDNYEEFKIMDANRDVNHHKAIVESIKKVGYIPSPICVNENMEIIDGQNRYCALKELGLPVQYYIVKGIGIEEAISLNIGQKNWAPIDYVKSYANQGYKSYIELLSLVEKYNKAKILSLREIISVCKELVSASGIQIKDIKDGSFSLTEVQIKSAEKKMEYLIELEDVIPQMLGERKLIISGIAFCLGIKGCDPKRMIKNVRSRYTSIRPACDTDLFLGDLTKVYNYKLPKEKWIYFDFEYKTR